jgi:xylan 1,4-beta-xylosidase
MDWVPLVSLASVCLIGSSPTTLGTGGEMTVTVDLNAATVRRSQLPTFSVGSDRAKIFLRPEHQRDLEDLQSAIGFRYLRCHGIFNEEMKIVSRRSDGSLAFDWSNVDRFLDQLKRAKLRPFVELGFMPEPMASGSQTIFWWNGNVTPPKSQAEWAGLLRAFAEHEIARCGATEVRKWYFEVWNEPNLDGFWTGGQAGYFELYAAGARALKSVDSKLRVGGPSTAGMGWIPEFLAFCRDQKVPVDFVSSHSYGSTEGFLDEHGHTRTVLDTSPGSLTGEFKAARKAIDESAFPKLPLFISEWGPSYSPRDPMHDSYICAPFILEKLRNNEGVVDGMSYWAFSDQFEEPGPPNTPFHGGFGLMNVDGLHKPAFLAYRLLAQLRGREIATGNRRLIACLDRDRLSLLLWDYTPPKQDEPDDPFFHRDLKPDSLPHAVLTLKGLRPGTYAVTRVGIGYRRNDLYGEYLALGKPQGNGSHLPESVLAKLRDATKARPESLPDLSVGDDGQAIIRLPMRTNDVWFVTVKPRRSRLR